jgi:hypothetical protein
MELWSGRKPSIKFFRVFGCCAYARIPRPSWKGKFAARATKGVFVGYDENRKGYRIWSQDDQDIIHSRDVKFIESEKGWIHQSDKEEKTEEKQDYALIDLGIKDTDPGNQEVEIAEFQEPGDEESQTGNQESEDSEENENIIDEEMSKSDGNGPTAEEEEEEEEEEVVDLEKDIARWNGQRNLRVRTPAIRPAKYSMVTRQPNRVGTSVEELTRIYGWNKHEWWEK